MSKDSRPDRTGSEKFEKMTEIVKRANNATETDQLTLYALFKQVRKGDALPDLKPGMLDFVGKAKYNEWAKHEGKSQEDAEKEYIEYAVGVIKKNGLKDGEELPAEYTSK